MEQLQIFMYNEEQVRTIYHNNEPMFVGKDVANVLGFKDSTNAIKQHVDLEDKLVGRQNTTPSFVDSLGRNQYPTLINESGLYSLIFGSTLPTAKKFKRWVTSEVLPNIRKHGTHMTPETIEKVLADPDTIIQIATQLKEERAKRHQAEVLIEQQKPKVLFAQAVEASESSILVGQLAKLLTQNGVKIGQNRLFALLRNQGYLGKKGAHYNEPTQYAVERGWFEVIERAIPKPDGSVVVSRTTKVTGKGQIYLIDKLLAKVV